MARHLSAVASVAAVIDDLEVLVSQWGTWQQAQGLSRNTISSRCARVRIFARTVGVNPATATADDVSRYLSGLASRSTKATYYSHLRAWFKWLVRAGHRIDDPTLKMIAPKAPRRYPRPVADEHLRKLLATRMHRRTRMMILLAVTQGLRVHEIAKVCGEDVDLVGREMTVIGKGEVTSVLPLHEMVAALAPMFPRRGWWFPTYVGNIDGPAGPILARSVSDIIKDAMQRAGVPGSAHSLRHWFGTELIDSGTDVRVAQTLLRHASLQTTQIYTQISRPRQREAIDRLRVGLLIV